MRLTGGLNHGGGIVQADDGRLRPPAAERCGAVAGSTSEIYDALGSWELEALDEIDRGLGALVRELEVEIGVPLGHAAAF